MSVADKPKIPSAIIIITVIFFFPIGFLLLILRFLLHSNVNHHRAKDYRLVGHSLLVLTLLLILLLVVTNYDKTSMSSLSTSVIVTAIIFGIPITAFYILGGSRASKMRTLYGRYRHLVTEQRIDSIARIAELTGESERNVRQDLSYLIAIGDLPASMYEGSAYLTILRPSPPFQDDRFAREQVAAAQEAATAPDQAITCEGCGATSRIVPGVRRQCQYCGKDLFIQA
ncbi:hypothetical protein [Cohnella soli]|uniref:Uncharacterized protein n=1 Tax=Cohnella soli TaxID=425005 RepID=A0ABW0I1V4_9BACL